MIPDTTDAAPGRDTPAHEDPGCGHARERLGDNMHRKQAAACPRPAEPVPVMMWTQTRPNLFVNELNEEHHRKKLQGKPR